VANYPTALPSATPATHAEVLAELRAIATELGLDPSGASATVAARLSGLATDLTDLTTQLSTDESALTALGTGLALKLDASQKGAASGVAPLDSGSRVPDANLPARLQTSALDTAYGSTAVFDVRKYGAVSDAVLTSATTGTDARASIQSAIDAANTFGGGIVDGGGGTYVVKSSPGLNVKAGVTLANMTVVQGWWGGLFVGLISASGTYTNTDVTGAVLSANVASGIKILTLTSTANLTAGQTYLLGSDRAYMDAPTSSSNDQLRNRGELVTIDTIDSGTQVTLKTATRDDYATANAASLHAVTLLDRPGLRNVRVVNPEPNAHQGDGVKFSYCRDFRLDNVTVETTDGAGFHMDMCVDGKVDIHVRNLTDNSGSGRYGYGCSPTGPPRTCCAGSPPEAAGTPSPPTASTTAAASRATSPSPVPPKAPAQTPSTPTSRAPTSRSSAARFPGHP
jgi:hypothetical protein